MTTSEDRDRVTRLEVAYEFVKENMSTQADVARLEGRVDAVEARLEGRMDALEERLDGKIDALGNRLLLRFVAVAVVMSSVIIGVLKLWP